MSKWKIILIVVLVIAVVGGVVGYRMWNKPHAQVEDVAGIKVTTTELVQAYEEDEAAANEKYLDEAIQVTGTVTGTETNQDGQLLVILDDNVQCTMKDKNTSVSESEKVTVKGFCSGSSLFGVVLREGVIVQ